MINNYFTWSDKAKAKNILIDFDMNNHVSKHNQSQPHSYVGHLFIGSLKIKMSFLDLEKTLAEIESLFSQPVSDDSIDFTIKTQSISVTKSDLELLYDTLLNAGRVYSRRINLNVN